jgi:hypothetical protein
MQFQGELSFQSKPGGDGLAMWVAVQQMAVDAAAEKLNLPLGHRAEVWLRGGIRLRGTLRPRNEVLFIEENRIRNLALEIDRVSFTYAEMESCVRLEGGR